MFSKQKYPPKKDRVRAVSIQTGYMIQSQGPNFCSLTYMAQVDPRGNYNTQHTNTHLHTYTKKLHTHKLRE